MLDIALQFLRDEVNTYLLTRTGVDTVTVQLRRIVEDSGKYAVENGVIGLSVINIEEERTVKTHEPAYVYVDGQHVVRQPELKLNLYIMFAANLKEYADALKYLSYLLTFFQAHGSFTSEEFPGLDSRIEKLTLELQSLSYEQLNQVWAFIGAKQLPSVIYRLRMVILEPDMPSSVQLPLTKIHATIQRR
jgi:hypothetical protein